MGVSVREKVRGSGDYWIFIRHAGLRVSQHAGERDIAEDAAKEIRKEIRTGRFDIGAMKAARAPEKSKEAGETLRHYYEKTVRPLWDGSLSRNTYRSYDSSFRVHSADARRSLLA